MSVFLAEELYCHLLPPRPIVTESLPYIQDMRYLLRAEFVREFHTLIEERVLIAGREDVIIPPDTFQKPLVREIGQVIERGMEVGVGVIIPVEKPLRNVERARHTDSVGHQVGMRQC